jgi:hypothetical protein
MPEFVRPRLRGCHARLPAEKEKQQKARRRLNAAMNLTAHSLRFLLSSNEFAAAFRGTQIEGKLSEGCGQGKAV